MALKGLVAGFHEGYFAVWEGHRPHRLKGEKTKFFSHIQQNNRMLLYLIALNLWRICDRLWGNRPLRALLQNRVIGIQG